MIVRILRSIGRNISIKAITTPIMSNVTIKEISIDYPKRLGEDVLSYTLIYNPRRLPNRSQRIRRITTMPTGP
jgi:hypothetical protein